MNFNKQLKDGLIYQNPVLVQVLGMCSTMAITTSVANGFGMGISVLIILTLSNIFISLLRKIIPNEVRIACYIVVIAGFVTIVDLCLQAFVPDIAESLGVFIPLIVVNCIILGRAEAFASKNSVAASAVDGICQGIGYTVVLLILSAFRELLGAGTLLGIQIMPSSYVPAGMLTLPVGGFLCLGTLIAVCAVYYKLIWRLIKAFISLVADVFRGKFKWKDMDHDRRLLMMLMIGLIPLFLLFLPVPGTGMKLKDISELWASDSTIWIEGLALLMTSALLFLGIRASKGAKVHHFTRKDGKVGEIRGRTKFHTADAICVGVTQCAAAVFPGLSRSGSTMAAGLLRGINQQAALDYSFVLGIPSILAAAVLTIKDAIGQPVDIGVGAMIAGVVTAAIVGFLAIKLLKWIVTTNKLQVFAYYTLVLGVITLIVSVIEAVTGTNLFTGMPL